MPVIIVRFKRNFNSRVRFSENSQIWNLIKIRPVGGKLFHEERQADMTKLTVAFRSFANAPKGGKFPSNKWKYKPMVLPHRRIHYFKPLTKHVTNTALVTSITRGLTWNIKFCYIKFSSERNKTARDRLHQLQSNYTSESCHRFLCNIINMISGNEILFSENKFKSYPDQTPTLTTSNHNQKHGPVCIASFTLAMEHVACKCGASGKLKLYAPFGSLWRGN